MSKYESTRPSHGSDHRSDQPRRQPALFHSRSLASDEVLTGPGDRDDLVGKVIPVSDTTTQTTGGGTVHVVEHYEVERLLGQGGMGTVYAAKHVKKHTTEEPGKPPVIQSHTRNVALKVLHSGADSDSVDRFFHEMGIASRLKSQHTVRVEPFSTTSDGTTYCVMELLEGDNLRKRIEDKNRLSWPVAKKTILQVCSALHATHNYADPDTGYTEPIVHSDLKPENIFLHREADGSEIVKVLDFGLAKHFTVIDGEVDTTQRHGGTLEYMSPEQLENGMLDPRSDIYAVGVVLYEMLTGKVPFEHLEFVPIQDFVAYVCNTSNKPRRFSETAPGIQIPTEVETIVMRCLEKDPNLRYQSIEELTAALKECDAGEDGRTVRPGVLQSAGWRSLGWVLLPIALLGIFGLLTNDAVRRPDSTLPTQVQQTSDRPIAVPTKNIPQVVEPPLETQIDADVQQPTPDAQPVKIYSITINAGVAGVNIFHGAVRLGTTDTSGAVNIHLDAGSEGVELILTKRGYEPNSLTLVPDQDQRFSVSMQPRRRRLDGGTNDDSQDSQETTPVPQPILVPEDVALRPPMAPEEVELRSLTPKDK